MVSQASRPTANYFFVRQVDDAHEKAAQSPNKNPYR